MPVYVFTAKSLDQPVQKVVFGFPGTAKKAFKWLQDNNRVTGDYSGAMFDGKKPAVLHIDINPGPTPQQQAPQAQQQGSSVEDNGSGLIVERQKPKPVKPARIVIDENGRYHSVPDESDSPPPAPPPPSRATQPFDEGQSKEDFM